MSSLKEESGNSNNIANAPEASNAATDASDSKNLDSLVQDLPFKIETISRLFTGACHPNGTAHYIPVTQIDPCLITLEGNIRILSIPSILSQVVVLEPPTSLTLQGYVKVTVCLGNVCIYGYEVNEEETVEVFSTEGTGLKKVVALNSERKSTIEALKTKLQKKIFDQDVDIEKFTSSIQPNAVVFIVEKAMLPAPLRILGLYYQNALRTKRPSDTKIKREEKFELCNTQASHVIDISDDFKMLSEEVNQMICQPVSDGGFGPRILITGEKNLGKSTLIRYLMNSSLNKHPVFYFLDTDLDQAEYTPPGVVSLFRVTKPLLGPPFAHQEKPLQMVFVGSISPETCPYLYDRSVICLMRFFNTFYPKETLFVNTMGRRHGIVQLCLESIRLAVKPTAVITLVPPDPNLSLRKDVAEVINFVVPSKVPSGERLLPFSDAEKRNFNILTYLSQCERTLLSVTPIISLKAFTFEINSIALHVMGKKVSSNHLVKTIPCSMVALCNVDPSCVVRSSNREIPNTLSDDLVHKCLGFGFVKGTDETNRFFKLITPLTRDELINVNAFITGQIAIPAAIFLKQISLPNQPLSTRAYIKQFLPILLEGVLKITFVRPDDPIQYLADWMLTFKDAFYNKMFGFDS